MKRILFLLIIAIAMAVGIGGYGIHLPLFYRIARAIFDLGFRGGEISWVLADNRPILFKKGGDLSSPLLSGFVRERPFFPAINCAAAFIVWF